MNDIIKKLEAKDIYIDGMQRIYSCGRFFITWSLRACGKDDLEDFLHGQHICEIELDFKTMDFKIEWGNNLELDYETVQLVLSLVDELESIYC